MIYTCAIISFSPEYLQTEKRSIRERAGQGAPCSTAGRVWEWLPGFRTERWTCGVYIQLGLRPSQGHRQHCRQWWQVAPGYCWKVCFETLLSFLSSINEREMWLRDVHAYHIWYFSMWPSSIISVFFYLCCCWAFHLSNCFSMSFFVTLFFIVFLYHMLLQYLSLTHCSSTFLYHIVLQCLSLSHYASMSFCITLFFIFLYHIWPKSNVCFPYAWI